MNVGPPAWILGALVVLTVLSFISFLVAPFVAWKKGYSPYYWLIACGPIGLVVIICWPSLKSATNPEQYERLESRTNLIGAVLSGIAICLGLIIPLFLANWFIGF